MCILKIYKYNNYLIQMKIYTRVIIGMYGCRGEGGGRSGGLDQDSPGILEIKICLK